MLFILSDAQKVKLISLAKTQVRQINAFGYKRFPFMKTFRRQVEGDLPAGSLGLNKQAVIEYSKELYRFDGKLSLQRAQVLGSIIHSPNKEQKS